MDKILVSVIVPAYNIENYISRCLDSLIAQTYRNLQIIVVDDGSTDKTGAIVNDYSAKDSRILPIHQQNKGVSSARLAGLEKIKGDYIGFVDGDDVAEPEMYEHLLANAIQYNADISHCGYKMVFPDGHEDLYHGTGKLVIHNREQGLTALLKGDLVEPGLVNKLYRRSLLEGLIDSPLWDINIRMNEDLLMNYIIFKKAEISVFEDVVLYNYLLRKNSAATAEPQLYSVQDPLKVITLIKGDIKDDSSYAGVVYERYIRALIKVTEQDRFYHEKKDARDKLKAEIRNKEHLRLCSKRTRILTFGTVFFPSGYRLVHKVYGRITGTANKYKI